MSDVQITGRVKEQIAVRTDFSVDGGTGIISSPTFTLLDHNGTTILDAVSVTLYNNTALASGSIEYKLDTTSMNPGVYYGYFLFKLTTSDTMVRWPLPDIQIAIWPIVDKVATYDPGNYRGRIRDWLRDKAEIPTSSGTAMGIINPIWSDGDVDNFLAQVDSSASPTGTTIDQSTVLMSASLGWQQTAGDKALLATIEKIAIFTSNTKTTYDAVLDYAQFLKNEALSLMVPSVGSSSNLNSDGSVNFWPDSNCSGVASGYNPNGGCRTHMRDW